MHLQQFSDHCDTYDMLPEYQSAYRKHFSCKTSLLKLTNDSLYKNITTVIILDLSAAFDTVDHNLLLESLDKKFGIKDKPLSCYAQYLKPRRFRLCINGRYSQENNNGIQCPIGVHTRYLTFHKLCIDSG